MTYKQLGTMIGIMNIERIERTIPKMSGEIQCADFRFSFYDKKFSVSVYGTQDFDSQLESAYEKAINEVFEAVSQCIDKFDLL